MQPVEALVLPEHLDGCDGTHRGTRETAQLAARNDLDAVRASPMVAAPPVRSVERLF
ncbi:hypothetical protein IHE29_00860 (plasmid) [Mycetohabitans rhizoxinica]|uniref:Uncharacterized protein n=1 Tax=Mycetohabitans rhizoxinica TaxID=412963 RepID=A0ABZ2PZS0_9BURK